MDKISIIVPCCNVEKYVEECLESIKVQTYKNIEVICIDDGSTDNTGLIIDKYVLADNRFKVIHKSNSGYGDSMNKGLEACTGDYVGIVESDDWIEPDMFETLYKTAIDNDLDLVRCCWYEGPTGTESENHQDWVKKDSVYCPLEKTTVFFQQPSIWVGLYRRDLLEEGRKIRFLPTPGASYQDTSFAFKVYTKSKRFMMLDKPFHHYRINPNSSVSSSGKVYCIIDEWEEMRRWVCEDVILKSIFVKSSLLPRICHGGMLWNYNRLSHNIYKLLFLRRASQFFRQAEADGIFNVHEFGNELGGRAILKVKDTPLDYHYERISECYNMLTSYKDFYIENQPDLISVVVTCYNTSKYIYSSLMSILSQSYRNIEIICVDDCSTDDTKLVVHHLMRKDSRIKWLSTDKNSGQSVARNIAIKKCLGKYVLFVDGDDFLIPGAISRLYASMQEDDDVVAGAIDMYYEGGEWQYGSLVESDKKYYTNKEEKKLNAISDINSALDVNSSVSAKLWRMSIITNKNITFPDGLLYEDTCFYWKYLCVASRLHVIKDFVYLYQRHLVGSTMSTTFNKKPGMAIQHIHILDNIYEYAKENHLEERVIPILNKVYEPYFWFAFNNSPQSDYDAVLNSMCMLLKRHQADTSKSPLLDYISSYAEISKSDIFIKAFNGNRVAANTISPEVYRLNKKLRKYRKLTKIFAILSIVLLIALIIVTLFAI